MQWEAEQRRGELEQGTGTSRSHGDREISVRNSEQISQTSEIIGASDKVKKTVSAATEK